MSAAEDLFGESLEWAKKFEDVFAELKNLPPEQFLETLKELQLEGKDIPDCKEKEVLLDLNETTMEMMSFRKQLEVCDPKEKDKLDREWHKCAAYGAFLIFLLASLEPHEKIMNQKKGPKHPYESYVEKLDDDPWKFN
jgi:hypothetical protein